MNCVYTGACVFLHEYNAYVIGDLFDDGVTCVVQWVPRSFTYERPRKVTHTVIIGDGYHNTDRGFTVVPSMQCDGERR